jgi:4-hydroxy-tetrahydrodipicolinate reductase
MLARPPRVLQVGLGPIGQRTLRAALRRPGLRVVGAVDPAPALAGRDLGDVLGLRRPLGLRVEPDLATALRRLRPQIALHTTVSALDAAARQIAPLLAAGIDVVSSTEELAYPWISRPALARKIDRLARRGGATVHATGVNPGFAMDVLPLVLSHAAARVDAIQVRRIVNVATRREALRRKVGAGRTAPEFRALARQGKIGHVGLVGSMQMLAAGLGWRIERLAHRLEPVLARHRFAGPPEVRRGEVAGQRELLRGFVGGRERLRFELVIAMGARDPVDEVVLRGVPALTLRVPGGIAGDAATVAALRNAIPRVLAAEPGLRTALDLPLPSYGVR